MSSRQVSPVYFDMLVSVCRSHGFAPLVLHEVRSVSSQIAYVGCDQSLALVPSAMRKLALASGCRRQFRSEKLGPEMRCALAAPHTACASNAT